MKIVVCSNCGAKYQLEDSDDVNTFECSVCTGNLEELNEDNQVSNKVNEFELDSNLDSSSVIVCCQNCGLKFELDKSENIFDFECVSCGGPLKYLDDELNKMYDLKVVDNSTDDSPHEVEIIDDDNDNTFDNNVDSLNYDSDDGFIIVEHNNEEKIVSDADGSLNQDNLNKVNDNIIEHPQINQENDLSNFNKYATETDDVNESEVYTDNSNNIPNNSSNNFTNDSVYNKLNNEESINSKVETIDSKDESNYKIVKNDLVFDNVQEYERYELTLLRTYNALKDSIKKEYLMELDNEIFINGVPSYDNGNRGPDNNKPYNLEKAAGEYSEPINQMTYKNLVDSRKDSTNKYNYFIPFIFGILFIIAGIAVYLLLNLLGPMGILIAIGVVLIIYGIYKKLDSDDVEVRTRIIREKLEELPQGFYLFYYTKPPYAKAPLNHVIVGPTGVFTILSQKYSAKQDKDRQKSDVENNALVSGASDIGNYMNNRNTLELTGGYDDNQTRFQFGNEEIQFDYNNKIKHKSLTLNEDLAIFLDKSGISGVYIEPLIGFINEDVAVINVVLTNEDLFLEELLYKIVNGPRRLDPFEVMRISKLLSRYSINCKMEN